MPGPEALQALADVLIKLSEASKGPTPPARVAKREVAAKEMAKSLSERAKEWAEKVMSKDKKVRQEAKNKEKELTQEKNEKISYKYSNADTKLAVARDKLTTVQDGDASRTPAGLESSPEKINQTAIAEYTATLTQINRMPEEYRDPHVVYEEVGKLYRTIDWVNATPTQKAEARRAIDAGLKYVKQAARAHEEGSKFAMQILEDTSTVDYRLNLGISDEQHFDLYKSRTLQKQVPPNGDPDYAKVLEHNAQTADLDRMLTNAQKALNGTSTAESEIDVLKRYQEKILSGLDDGKYTEEQAGTYRDLIRARLEDITPPPGEGGVRVGQRGKPEVGAASESPVLSPTQQQELINNIPDEFKALAKKIFKLYDRDATQDELQQLSAEFNKATRGVSAQSEIHKYIREKAGRDAGDEGLLAESARLHSRLDTLQHVIDDKLRPLMHISGYERAYFGLHPEHLKFLNDMDLRGRSTTALTDGEKQTLFKIAHGIIDRAEDNPRAQFREGMDLYTSDNWKVFISTLRDKAEQANWHPAQVDKLSNLFTGVREMRELVHDLEFVSNFAGLEILEKFAGNTLAGDLDTWLHYTPAMRYAFATYNEKMRNIIAQNGGYLPPELVDPSMVDLTFLDRLCYQQLEEALKSGKVSELESLSAAYRSEDPKIKAEAQREMARALKVAKAFGTLTLRTPTLMAEAKTPVNFISGPQNNIIQDMDPMRHLLVKYGLGKEARSRMWVALTHDSEGAKRMLTMSDHEVDQFVYEMEAHPKYGKSIAEFRNFLKMPDRFGDGKSFWGLVMGMKDFPQELRDVRGVGVKLHDAAGRAAQEVRKNHAAEIDAKFGAGASEDIRWEIEEWWNIRAHEPDVHHEFQHNFEHHVKDAMKELYYKVPGEMIDRSSMDIGYERLGFDAVQRALEKTNPELLKRILKNEDGSDLTIVRGGQTRRIDSLWDLFNVDTGNKPGAMHEGIPRETKADLNRRLDLMNGYAYQMKGDLTIVQQILIDKHWRSAEGKSGGVKFDVHDMKKGLLDGYIDEAFDKGTKIFGENGSVIGEISATKRKALVKEYIDAIDVVTSQEVSHAYRGETIRKPSYKEYLETRFLEGWEHNVITTTDVPLHKLRYANWGSSVLTRTIGDAKSVSIAGKGIFESLGTLDGHPNYEKFAEVIAEKVLAPLSAADPELARNVGGFMWDTFFHLYRGSDTVSNLGFVGDLISSELAIETAESISKALGYGGNIPDFMWGSNSKKLIDAGAMLLKADDIWKIVRFAAEKSQLPKSHHPLGWTKSTYAPRSYTKEALRDAYHGNVRNIIPQAFMTVMPIAIGITLYQAVTESDERSSHH